jgi:hypothetical protein
MTTQLQLKITSSPFSSLFQTDFLEMNDSSSLQKASDLKLSEKKTSDLQPSTSYDFGSFANQINELQRVYFFSNEFQDLLKTTSFTFRLPFSIFNQVETDSVSFELTNDIVEHGLSHLLHLYVSHNIEVRWDQMFHELCYKQLTLKQAEIAHVVIFSLVKQQSGGIVHGKKIAYLTLLKTAIYHYNLFSIILSCVQSENIIIQWEDIAPIAIAHNFETFSLCFEHFGKEKISEQDCSLLSTSSQQSTKDILVTALKYHNKAIRDDFLLQLINHQFVALNDLLAAELSPCFVFILETRRKQRIGHICDILRELLPWNILNHVLSPLINYE